MQTSHSSITNEKWFKNFSEGNIEMKDLAYTLRPTDNKRNLIFDNNILVATSSKKIIINSFELTLSG